MSQEINNFFQAARHDRNAVRTLQKMSRHFGLKGIPPHHKRPSATAVIRALIDGDLDLIDKDGRRFWDE